jgi:hypothetical protein
LTFHWFLSIYLVGWVGRQNSEKEVCMRRGLDSILLISVTALFSLSSASLDARIKEIKLEDLTGKKVLNFSLLS